MPTRINKGNWEALPLHAPLRMSQAAAILGISPDSLRNNYCKTRQLRKPPVPIQPLKENGRCWGIMRVG